jgi:hypothetical protein
VLNKVSGASTICARLRWPNAATKFDLVVVGLAVPPRLAATLPMRLSTLVAFRKSVVRISGLTPPAW